MKMVTPPTLEDGKETVKDHCVNLEKLFCSVCRKNQGIKLTLLGIQENG